MLKSIKMSILDIIQTICAVISIILSFYALNEVYKMKNTIKGDIKSVKQDIKGNNNNQNVGHTNSIK